MEVKEIIWYVPLELNHSSYIFTSIYEYCKLNEVKLIVSTKNLNRKGRINVKKDYFLEHNFFDKVCYATILYEKGDHLNLAFDLYDIPYYFSEKAYDWADIVYKRSYQENFVKKLPETYQLKTNTLGLPFMVRPDKIEAELKKKIFALYILFNWKRFIKKDRLILKRFYKYYTYVTHSWNFFKKTRTVSDFETFRLPENDKVFYQKRLFSGNLSTDIKEIHRDRISLVKSLKINFPKNFIGGIKEDEISKLECPELISNIGTQNEFLKALRNAGICVYTRGLSNSTGWTLSEFMSQGKCIVAESIYNDIQNPPIHEKELIYFDNNKALVAWCRKTR